MSTVAQVMEKRGLLPPPGPGGGVPPAGPGTGSAPGGGAGGGAAAPPAPAPQPAPPPNPKQVIAEGLKKTGEKVQAVNDVVSKANSYAQMAADPAAAIGGALDEKIGSLVSGLSDALPPFPAATMLKIALGIPHAHVKHPPSGPPPLPPIPLPPLGPAMLGHCISVLINGMPTARCGDYGLNPTCCGVVPPLSALYEIVTGSSKVYIGGKRAARANIDITMHCFKIPAVSGVVKSAALAKIAGAVGKVAAVAGKVAGVVGKVAKVVGTVNSAVSLATTVAEAEADDLAAMAAAAALNAAIQAAQAAADKAAAAMTKQIGTDQPMIPPIGTPGMFLTGSPNVVISGFPLPSFSAIAEGVAKRLKGLKFEAPKPGGKPKKPPKGPPPPEEAGCGVCPIPRP